MFACVAANIELAVCQYPREIAKYIFILQNFTEI